MRKRWVMAALILIFLFVAPVQPVIGQGPCSGCSERYTTSLSCDVVPLGDYYSSGGVGLGCTGPLQA